MLRPGAPIERSLAPDATLRLTLPLQAGDYVEITVEQLGIDAIVAVTGPDGAAIDEVDDTSELDGPERVRVIAVTTGDHALAVRSEPLPAVKAGRCRLAMGEPRPATDADRALAAARAAATERATALQTRYEDLRKSGRHDATEDAKLIDALGDVARLALDAGRLRQADRARASQAYLLLIQDRAPEVIAIVERRLAWLKGARYTAARASALTQLAEASTRVGESSRAIELFQEALTIPQPPGSEAITRDNLGATLRRVGRLQEALDAHQRALEYFRTAGPRRSVAVVLNRLALVWRQLGDLERAIAFDTQSLEVFVEIGDKPGELRALANLAANQREAGEYDLARATAERALRLAIDAKSSFQEGHASLVLANLELRVGNPAVAAERADRAASLFRELEFKAGEAVALQALGDAQLGLGQLPEAEETLRQAIAATRAVGNPDDEAAALSSAASVARARGRLTDARAWLEDALACIERIRASLGGAQLRASLVSLNHGVYEDHVDVLASLHRERPTEGFDRLALEASELSRARSLLDVLATSSIDIRAGVDATLLDRERALRQRLADKDVARHRAEDNGQAAAAAALEREIGELTDALRATESGIAASGPAFAALTRPRAIRCRRAAPRRPRRRHGAAGVRRRQRSHLALRAHADHARHVRPARAQDPESGGPRRHRRRDRQAARRRVPGCGARRRAAHRPRRAEHAAARADRRSPARSLAGQAARRGGVGRARIRAVRGAAAARRRRGRAGGPARRGPRGRGRAIGRGHRGAAARDRRPRAGDEDAGHRRRPGVRGGRSACRARAADADARAPPRGGRRIRCAGRTGRPCRRRSPPTAAPPASRSAACCSRGAKRPR